MSYSKLKSLVANVEAIATAMKIRIDDRQATDQEKEVLSRYSGFGGIKDVLNIGTEHTVSDDVAEPIRKLQDLIGAYPYYDDAMRQAVINSIKSSVLTAFYTPKFLVDAVTRQIHATFKDNCLQMSTFLEPSAGIGGFLPVSMPGTRSYAFEKDCLTGLILSLLYDEATTVTAGFETIADQHLEHESFDVIASNIPFGN